MTRLHEIRRILLWVLLLNVLVATAKWTYGVFTRTVSMEADGLHSFFDGASTLVGLLGLWLATPPPDDRHPYGHKKFETLTAGAIGSFLVFTCLYLLWKAYRSWTLALHPNVTSLNFAVMIITMGINLFVTRWEHQKGTQLKSDILLADSYHTASDVLTSFSVLAGLVLVRMGYTAADSLITVLIAGVIAWTAYVVLQDVLASLTDAIRLDPGEIREAVMTLSGVLDCHDIRTRGPSNHVFVDLSIHVEPSWSIDQAHRLATQVETFLISRFSSVEDVVVHIEPEGHSHCPSTGKQNSLTRAEQERSP